MPATAWSARVAERTTPERPGALGWWRRQSLRARLTILAADVSAGNRPSFTGAANAELGRALYERLLATARAQHPLVASGAFGADMQVELVNDGPVTILLRMS